ncbi:Concanavalin A-like lectin/glucanase domain containing protein [Amanita muscaria]
MRFNLLSSTALLLNAHHLAASVLRLDTLLDTPINTPDAITHKLADHYTGYDFLDRFQWETGNDPTHGRVDYVSKQDALDKNLTYASQNKFVMRADSVNVVSPYSRGRESVRIVSNAAYPEYILILSLDHMPEGCATWPAFWTVSKAGPWPQGGEIDIIEGVNTNNNNLASLHTNPNCTQNLNRDQVQQSGRTTTTDCDASVNYNIGCGVEFTRPNSFGHNFNANGGGTYIAQLSATDGIKVWFWSRSDRSAPSITTDGGSYPQQFSVNDFGEPDAYFSLLDNCDYKSHFDAHRIIFDLTLCGDWAGNGYLSAGCPGSCETFVNTQPAAFENAYWEIDYLLVYVPI